jgi:hypothetical protein
MSLATIRNPVLRDLGLDSSSSLVNDAKQRILDYINESIQEINILGRFDILKKEGTVTLVTDTADYSLAADCDVTQIVGERFYIDVDDAIVYQAATNQVFQDAEIRNNAGLPIIWIPFGKNSSEVSQIKVDPVPTSGENGKVMKYWYQRELTDLSTDSDTTPHQEVIIRHMTKAKYAEYDMDFAKRDRQMNLANNLLKKVQARNRGSVRFVPLTRKNVTSIDKVIGSY